MPSETEDQPKRPEVSPFADDQPISAREDDEFNRWPFAERVAKTLANPAQPKSGLVVAIYGAWGEGKTSVLHMIEKVLEGNERAICVRFNPWQFSSREKLIEGFFVTLAKSLGPSFSAKGKKITKPINNMGKVAVYASILTSDPVSFSFLKNILQKGKHIFRVVRLARAIISGLEIQTLKEEVEEFLIEEKKRVVVFIDDIDRLDREEIHEVFKLVKHTADFKNTTYVLAFDRDIVAASISARYGKGDKQSGYQSGYDFLEKIIQVPLHLPRADPDLQQRMVIEEIRSILNYMQDFPSEFEGNDFEFAFSSMFNIGFTTPRHMKRYLNALTFAVPLMEGEVNVNDQMLIEAIRIFYPKFYDLIRNHPGMFLNAWVTPEENIKEKAERFRKRVFDTINGLTEEAKGVIEQHLILRLFPELSLLLGGVEPDSEEREEWAREKRVCSREHFYRFFGYGMSDGDISDVEVSEFVESLHKSPQTEVNQRFIALAQQYPGFKLMNMLRRYTANELPSVSERALAISIAHGYEHLTPERPIGITGHHARDRAVKIVYNTIKNQDNVGGQISLACDVIDEARSLFFAWSVYAAVCGLDKEFEGRKLFSAEKKTEFGVVFAQKIQLAAESGSLFDSIGVHFVWLLNVWNNYINPNQIAAHLQAFFDESSQNLYKFLSTYAQFDDQGRHRPFLPRNFQDFQYDTVAELIAPDLIAQRIHETYGNALSHLHPKDEQGAPHDIDLLHQFMEVHFRKLDENKT